MVLMSAVASLLILHVPLCGVQTPCGRVSLTAAGGVCSCEHLRLWRSGGNSCHALQRHRLWTR